MDLTYDFVENFLFVKTLKKNENTHVIQGYLKNDLSRILIVKKLSLKPLNPCFLSKYRVLEKSESYLKENLKSPVIPRLLAKKNRAGSIYIMETYIPGITLNQLFYMKKRENRLYEKLKKGFLISSKENYCELKKTLEGFHGKKIIHGDIHLKNLMITEKGRIYMIDFNSSIVGDGLKLEIFREAEALEVKKFNFVWEAVEKNLYV